MEDALEDILGESNEMLLQATRESVRERGRESEREVYVRQAGLGEVSGLFLLRALV